VALATSIFRHVEVKRCDGTVGYPVLEVPVSGLRCEFATGGYFCVCEVYEAYEVYEVFSCMKTL
jgi:hypothetical protein